MEFSNAMEDALVLQYLEKMRDNAEKQSRLNRLNGNEQQWLEHLEVINRAIENSRTESYPIKKTA